MCSEVLAGGLLNSGPRRVLVAGGAQGGAGAAQPRAEALRLVRKPRAEALSYDSLKGLALCALMIVVRKGGAGRRVARLRILLESKLQDGAPLSVA